MPNERLRALLLERGVTPAKLAEAVLVDAKTIERWIVKGRTPYRRHRYAVAAFFLGLACYHGVPPLQLVLLLTAYGALLELGQLWVPGRHGQLSDIGADLAGASIGVTVALATMRLRRFAPAR